MKAQRATGPAATMAGWKDRLHKALRDPERALLILLGLAGLIENAQFDEPA